MERPVPAPREGKKPVPTPRRRIKANPEPDFQNSEQTTVDNSRVHQVAENLCLPDTEKMNNTERSDQFNTFSKRVSSASKQIAGEYTNMFPLFCMYVYTGGSTTNVETFTPLLYGNISLKNLLPIYLLGSNLRCLSPFSKYFTLKLVVTLTSSPNSNSDTCCQFNVNMSCTFL